MERGMITKEQAKEIIKLFPEAQPWVSRREVIQALNSAAGIKEENKQTLTETEFMKLEPW